MSYNDLWDLDALNPQKEKKYERESTTDKIEYEGYVDPINSHEGKQEARERIKREFDTVLEPFLDKNFGTDENVPKIEHFKDPAIILGNRITSHSDSFSSEDFHEAIKRASEWASKIAPIPISPDTYSYLVREYEKENSYTLPPIYPEGLENDDRD